MLLKSNQMNKGLMLAIVVLYERVYTNKHEKKIHCFYPDVAIATTDLKHFTKKDNAQSALQTPLQ